MFYYRTFRLNLYNKSTIFKSAGNNFYGPRGACCSHTIYSFKESYMKIRLALRNSRILNENAVERTVSVLENLALVAMFGRIQLKRNLCGCAITQF